MSNFVRPWTHNTGAVFALDPVPVHPDPDGEPWRKRALCAQTDSAVFYPEKGARNAEAKRICGLCTVRVPCLEEALEHNDTFGIWAGTTPRDRARIRQEREAAAQTSEQAAA